MKKNSLYREGIKGSIVNKNKEEKNWKKSWIKKGRNKSTTQKEEKVWDKLKTCENLLCTC